MLGRAWSVNPKKKEGGSPDSGPLARTQAILDLLGVLAASDTVQQDLVVETQTAAEGSERCLGEGFGVAEQ